MKDGGIDGSVGQRPVASRALFSGASRVEWKLGKIMEDIGPDERGVLIDAASAAPAQTAAIPPGR